MDETTETGHAARMKRMRDKQAETGLKSVSIVVPIVDHEQFKALAKRLVKGETWAEATIAMLPPRPPEPPVPPVPPAPPKPPKKLVTIEQLEAKQLADAAYKSTGWRRMILRWILTP